MLLLSYCIAKTFCICVEFEDRNGLISLTWTEDGRRPLWLVWSVRILLRLKADAGTLVIGDAMLALDSAIEKVARINLDARHVGLLYDCDTAFWAIEHACYWKVERILLRNEDPVVVVATCKLKLLIIGIDVVTDAAEAFSKEVEWCSWLNVANLTSRYHILVDRCSLFRDDKERVLLDAL